MQTIKNLRMVQSAEYLEDDIVVLSEYKHKDMSGFWIVHFLTRKSRESCVV